MVNLLIAPITGCTATKRAQAISAELFSISQPPQVRQPNAASTYLFGWQTHPTTGECVLIADENKVIYVHPDKNLAALLALFPTLSEAEKNGLAAYISNSQTFLFGAIIPSNSVILTPAQMEADGWNQTL